MAFNKLRTSIIEWLFPNHDMNRQSGEFTRLLSGNSKHEVNEKTALSNPAVWASVRVIAETIATLPCNIYYRNGDRREKAKHHSLYNILHNSPDGITTSINFFESVITHVLIYGNAFIEIVRDRFSNIESLNILNPNKIILKCCDILNLYQRLRK